MGIVGSKDDRGVRVLQALPPGFLDEKGKELRNALDICLEQNGWYFTIAGLALTVPLCFRYKTERPFYVAAILSPMADMYYGTLRCTAENDAFAKHYRYLHKKYHTPAWKTQQQQEQQDSDGDAGQTQQQQQQQQQRQQRQLQPGDGGGSCQQQQQARLQPGSKPSWQPQQEQGDGSLQEASREASPALPQQQQQHSSSSGGSWGWWGKRA